MTKPRPAKPAPPVWSALPASLAGRQQWLLWKFEWNEKRSTWAKMPYYVGGGRRAGGQGEDSDRRRLGVLDLVRRAFERDPDKWDGVGFAFLPGDGLIGIDIDKAVDPETGTPTERCQSIIDSCRGYTERSPSRTGVHIIVAGETTTNKSNDIGLEVFCGAQYFTFTGDRWPGTPDEVQPIDEVSLRRLHKTVNDAKAKHKAPPRPAPAAPAPGAAPPSSGSDDFARVNDIAMRALHAWVPTLLPKAEVYKDGYRVTSKALGRELEEDLSILPKGIKDFGLADTDARDGCRTPIDLVLEHSPAMSKPADALKWLAQLLGVALTPPPERNRHRGRLEKNRVDEAPAGGRGDAGDGGAGGPPGGGGDGGDGDDPLDRRDALDALWDALHKKSSGAPIDCRENVLYCMRLDLRLKGLVKQNLFTETHERSRRTPWGRDPGEWDDEDDLMLGEYLAREFGLLIKATANLRAGVVMAAREHKYNPVVDLIKSEKWDGVKRLESWLADVTDQAHTPYLSLVGSCFIKGMVARALWPGCKFDYMLILKGPQGAKKSTLFRTLAGQWFSDNAIRMGDKDSLLALQAVWLVESSELESMAKAESRAYKQFLSAIEDLFRPPYGARMIKRPRHAVFGGSTNEETFLRDATGDRRFWPVEVLEILIDVLAGMRLQLFAEALVAVQSEDPEVKRWYPTPAQEKALVFPEQERFKVTDVWEDVLYDYVNRPIRHKHENETTKPPAERDFFSTRELFEHALRVSMDRIDGNKIMENRIAGAMRAIGFDKHRESTGERMRGYKRRPAPPQADGSPGGPPPAPTPMPAPAEPLTPAAAALAGMDDDLPL